MLVLLPFSLIVGRNMAFQQPRYLSEEQLVEVLSSFSSDDTLSIVKVSYKNKLVIKRTEQMTLEAFKEFVLKSIESGWGADVELYVPSLNKTLIGHHDGVFWLE
jgi:hypothetical protein